MDAAAVPLTPDVLLLLARLQDDSTDSVARQALADALEEAGVTDEALLALFRGKHFWPHTAAFVSLVKQATYALHLALVLDDVVESEEQSRQAYRERRVSDGYWLANRVAALRGNPGYVEVEVGRLPHPARRLDGVVYIRPATSGQWGKPWAVRFGAPLTLSQMLTRIGGEA